MAQSRFEPGSVVKMDFIFLAGIPAGIAIAQKSFFYIRNPIQFYLHRSRLPIAVPEVPMF